MFFGIGMYVTAVVQRNMHFDIEEYVHVAGRVESLSPGDYLAGLFLGMGTGRVVAVSIAAGLGVPAFWGWACAANISGSALWDSAWPPASLPAAGNISAPVPDW